MLAYPRYLRTISSLDGRPEQEGLVYELVPISNENFNKTEKLDKVRGHVGATGA